VHGKNGYRYILHIESNFKQGSYRDIAAIGGMGSYGEHRIPRENRAPEGISASRRDKGSVPVSVPLGETVANIMYNVFILYFLKNDYVRSSVGAHTGGTSAKQQSFTQTIESCLVFFFRPSVLPDRILAEFAAIIGTVEQQLGIPGCNGQPIAVGTSHRKLATAGKGD